MTKLGRQRGLSMIGFLFTAAVVITVALIGFRVLPSYIEYFAVKKALEATLADDAVQNVRDVRNAMSRRMDAQYIDAVKAADIQVNKVGNALVATVSWQQVLHMIGNASILLDFNVEVSK